MIILIIILWITSGIVSFLLYERYIYGYINVEDIVLSVFLGPLCGIVGMLICISLWIIDRSTI